MPLDNVSRTYLGLVEERRPPLAALTQLFIDEVPMESGDTKVMFDRTDADEGLAPLVHWRLDGVPLAEQGDEMVEIEPAYLQIDNPLNPKRFLRRLPGEPIDAPYSARERRDAWLVIEMLRRERRKVRFVEWMVTKALTAGQLILTSPRYSSRVLDFGRNTNLLVALTAAARWGEAGVNPLVDLEDWSGRVEDESGSTAVTVVMGIGAWRKFAASQDVKDILDSRRGSAAAAELGPMAQDGLRLRGVFGDFEVWTASETYVDEEGVRQKYFPTNGVSISDPDGAMMRLAYGAVIHTETMDEPVPGEMFHHVYSSTNGKLENLYSASAPLVFPMRPDATFFATVY